MTTAIEYLFDPLCGWCYGAGPAIRALAQADGLPALVLRPTGLFAARGGRPMDRAFAAHAWASDQRINRLTGQPFSDRYRVQVLERPDCPFDSGMATRALTAVHRVEPAREVEALAAVQHARYVDGRDVSDPAVLTDVLTGLGIGDAADVAGADPALDTLVASRVADARVVMGAVGANGVPVLVLRRADGLRVLPNGLLYGDPGALVAAVRAAVNAGINAGR